MSKVVAILSILYIFVFVVFVVLSIRAYWIHTLTAYLSALITSHLLLFLSIVLISARKGE